MIPHRLRINFHLYFQRLCKFPNNPPPPPGKKIQYNCHSKVHDYMSVGFKKYPSIKLMCSVGKYSGQDRLFIELR